MVKEGSIHVRAWRREDLPRVEAVERAGFSDPWPTELFEQEMSNELARGLVAEQAQSSGVSLVVGFALWWVVCDEIHLLVLAVHPDARRHGVARALMAQLEEQAVVESAREILLEVRPSNLVAREFYRSLGFAEVGRRRRYYGDAEDALLLRRALSAEHGLEEE